MRMGAVVGIEHGWETEGLGCWEETPVHVELAKKNSRKGSTRGTIMGVGLGEEVTTVRLAPSHRRLLVLSKKGTKS